MFEEEVQALTPQTEGTGPPSTRPPREERMSNLPGYDGGRNNIAPGTGNNYGQITQDPISQTRAWVVSNLTALKSRHKITADTITDILAILRKVPNLTLEAQQELPDTADQLNNLAISSIFGIDYVEYDVCSSRGCSTLFSCQYSGQTTCPKC